MSDLIFPIYRKLRNGKAFYKINSLLVFEEIQIVGSKTRYYQHFAQQYPEKLRIQDMIFLHEGHYVESDENEWNQYSTD